MKAVCSPASYQPAPVKVGFELVTLTLQLIHICSQPREINFRFKFLIFSCLLQQSSLNSKISIYYCNFILSYNLGTAQAIILHITAREANTSTGARGRTFTLSEGSIFQLWATSDCECRAEQSWISVLLELRSSGSQHQLLAYAQVTCNSRCTLAPHPPSRLGRGRLRRRGDAGGTGGCAGKSRGRRWSLRRRPPGAPTSSLKITGTAPSARTSTSETNEIHQGTDIILVRLVDCEKLRPISGQYVENQSEYVRCKK